MLDYAGNVRRPLKLRAGETDFFYFLFDRVLAGDDVLVGTPTVQSSGVTAVAPTINTQPLTLDGEEYAIGTAITVQVSGIAEHDLVELECTCTTQTGRILKASGWIQGVPVY